MIRTKSTRRFLIEQFSDEILLNACSLNESKSKSSKFKIDKQLFGSIIAEAIQLDKSQRTQFYHQLEEGWKDALTKMVKKGTDGIEAVKKGIVKTGIKGAKLAGKGIKAAATSKAAKWTASKLKDSAEKVAIDVFGKDVVKKVKGTAKQIVDAIKATVSHWYDKAKSSILKIAEKLKSMGPECRQEDDTEKKADKEDTKEKPVQPRQNPLTILTTEVNARKKTLQNIISNVDKATVAEVETLSNDIAAFLTGFGKVVKSLKVEACSIEDAYRSMITEAYATKQDAQSDFGAACEMAKELYDHSLTIVTKEAGKVLQKDLDAFKEDATTLQEMLAELKTDWSAIKESLTEANKLDQSDLPVCDIAGPIKVIRTVMQTSTAQALFKKLGIKDGGESIVDTFTKKLHESRYSLVIATANLLFSFATGGVAINAARMAIIALLPTVFETWKKYIETKHKPEDGDEEAAAKLKNKLEWIELVESTIMLITKFLSLKKLVGAGWGFFSDFFEDGDIPDTDADVDADVDADADVELDEDGFPEGTETSHVAGRVLKTLDNTGESVDINGETVNVVGETSNGQIVYQTADGDYTYGNQTSININGRAFAFVNAPVDQVDKLHDLQDTAESMKANLDDVEGARDALKTASNFDLSAKNADFSQFECLKNSPKALANIQKAQAAIIKAKELDWTKGARETAYLKRLLKSYSEQLDTQVIKVTADLSTANVDASRQLIYLSKNY